MMILTFAISLVFAVFWYLVYFKVVSPKLKEKLREIKNLRLKHVIFSFFVFFISFFAGLATALNVSKLFYIQDVNGYAQWRNTNGQKYLYVEAQDYYSLGYLEGKHLASQIRNTHVMLQDFMGFLPEKYQQRASLYEVFIPEKFQEEMKGMAKGACRGSGFIITYEDILVQNLFPELIYGQYYAERNLLGCSSVAVKTNNSGAIFGQNFDFPTKIGEGELFESIAWVHHNLTTHDTNSPLNDVFSLRLGATLCTPIGKSGSNIWSLMNIIDSNQLGCVNVPISVRFRKAFESALTLNEFSREILLSPQTISYNLLICNKSDFKAFQFTPNQTRFIKNETISHTNRYGLEEWNDNYLNVPNFSLNRQNHLDFLISQKLAQSNEFSEGSLIEILATKENCFGPASAILQSSEKTSTLAFLTKSYFGLGNLADYKKGSIPF